MSKILDLRASIDQTIKIFDSFYGFDAVVNANDFDIVHSYFIGVCATKNIANNFTAVLFRIAQETGYGVLDLLSQIKGTSNNLEMNRVICYYLNSFKSKTSLYGIGQVPRPNQPVARNIVQ